MKVAFVGDYDEAEIVAAPIKVAKELFKQLQLLGVNVTFLTYFADGKKYNRFQKLFGKEEIDVNIKRLGIFPLIREIMKMKPEIVQLTNAASFYLILIPLKRILGFKLFYYAHSVITIILNHYNNYNRFQTFRFRIIEKTVNRFSDIILVLNTLDLRYLSLWMRVSRKKIHIVKNGVIESKECKKEWGFGEKIKLITIGSFIRKEKALNLLVDAISKMSLRIELTICNTVVQSITDLELPQNIFLRILDPMNEIELRREMIRHDVFIISSVYEPFSLALLEAMSTGILVIASDRVGLTEYFNSDLLKLVYPHNSTLHLRGKLLELLNMPLDEKSRTSKREIELSKKFSWLNSAQLLVNIYCEILCENHI